MAAWLFVASIALMAALYPMKCDRIPSPNTSAAECAMKNGARFLSFDRL